MRTLAKILGRVSFEADTASEWCTSASEGRIAVGPLVIVTRGYMARQAQKFMEMGADSYRRGWRPQQPPPSPQGRLHVV